MNNRADELEIFPLYKTRKNWSVCGNTLGPSSLTDIKITFDSLKFFKSYLSFILKIF